MKKVILSTILFCVSLCVMSQDDNIYRHVKVIKSTQGDTKEELYLKLRSFMATYFVNANFVIQMDDKEDGIIIGKATAPFNQKSIALSSYNGWLDYTINMQARDGRVRIELSHFSHRNKAGRWDKSQLGILTNDEKYPHKNLQRGPNTKVWKKLKLYADLISESTFMQVEKAINEERTFDTDSDEW